MLEATQVVPGEGSENAEIMFIGEGPGATEDKLGRPFVGPAGRFLDIMLESIGLKRSDVYIANMVKCRPPQNRDPFDDEKSACAPWLDEQIRLINPRVFVPLGRHALHKFLPDVTISTAHGRFFESEGRVVFAMYHPAVALYNGGMRKTLLEDFQNLKKYLDAGSDVINDKGVVVGGMGIRDSKAKGIRDSKAKGIRDSRGENTSDSQAKEEAVKLDSEESSPAVGQNTNSVSATAQEIRDILERSKNAREAKKKPDADDSQIGLFG